MRALELTSGSWDSRWNILHPFTREQVALADVRQAINVPFTIVYQQEMELAIARYNNLGQAQRASYAELSRRCLSHDFNVGPRNDSLATKRRRRRPRPSDRRRDIEANCRFSGNQTGTSGADSQRML
jgi:hypothetical protein